MVSPLNNVRLWCHNDFRRGKTTNYEVNIFGLWFMVVIVIWGLSTIIINVDVIVIISIALFFHLGVIIFKWAKNHVGQQKNYQFNHTYLCNVILMSRKFVLNELLKCCKIQKISIRLKTILIQKFWLGKKMNWW
jgi:hypothetical protein